MKDETLLRIVKYGVAAFFGLLLLVFFVPPLTARVRSSSAALLAFVLAMTVPITVAVGALALLNRRN